LWRQSWRVTGHRRRTSSAKRIAEQQEIAKREAEHVEQAKAKAARLASYRGA